MPLKLDALHKISAIEWAYAACAAIITAILLPHGWSPFDDGAYAWAARRLLDGAIPHRDLVMSHPGYATYLDYWLYRGFGERLIVLRYPLPLLAAVLTGAVAVLARPAGRSAQAVCALATMSLGIVQFISPSASWYAVVCAVAALCIFQTAFGRGTVRKTGLLFLAGILLGICGGFRQYNGALLGAGLVLLQALIATPHERAAAPWRQGISLIALVLAAVLLITPAVISGTSGAWLLSLPASICAAFAFRRWRAAPGIRDAAWLVPVGAGCLAGFLPVLAWPAKYDALSAFFADTVVDGSRYADYSPINGRNFTIVLTDAMDAFAMGTPYAFGVGAYLIAIGIMPLWLAVLLWRRRSLAMPPHAAAIAVSAAIALLNNIVFQDLLYAFFWLPLVCAAIVVLTKTPNSPARNWALAPIAAVALFGSIFHAGRIPGSNWRDIIGTPFPKQVACALPACGLRVDPALNERLYSRYRDLVANVPRSAPLMILPDGANLYGFLPHRSPWSIGWVSEGFTHEAEYARLQKEFMTTPDAVLAIPLQYFSTPSAVTGLDSLIAKACPQRRTPQHRLYRNCQSTTKADTPRPRP